MGCVVIEKPEHGIARTWSVRLSGFPAAVLVCVPLQYALGVSLI